MWGAGETDGEAVSVYIIVHVESINLKASTAARRRRLTPTADLPYAVHICREIRCAAIGEAADEQRSAGVSS